MKAKELRGKSVEELGELLIAGTKKIAEVQFQHVHTRSKNVKETRELRRERARILTLLREKQS